MIRTALVAACAALALGACQTQPLAGGQSAVVIAQGEVGLEAVYNVAANTYLAAIAAGGTQAAIARPLKPKVQAIYRAVIAARRAQALGQATTVSAQIAIAQDLANQVRAVLNPSGAPVSTATPPPGAPR